MVQINIVPEVGASLPAEVGALNTIKVEATAKLLKYSAVYNISGVSD